jgi:hypothetical protein
MPSGRLSLAALPIKTNVCLARNLARLLHIAGAMNTTTAAPGSDRLRTLSLSLALLSALSVSGPARADTRVATAEPTTTTPADQRIVMMPSPPRSDPSATSATAAGPSRILLASYMESADGSNDRSGFGIEASARLDGMVFIHGGLVFGDTVAIVEPTGISVGDFMQLRVGIEGRGDGKSVRALGGIDAAYQRDSLVYVGLVETLAVIPRIGVEVGNKVRARGMLEVPLELGGYGVDAGLGLSIALGAAF